MNKQLSDLFGSLSISDADDEFKEMWMIDARYIFQRVVQDNAEGKDTTTLAYARKLAKMVEFILVSEVFVIAKLARGE